MPEDTLRIVIADDHPLFRPGLRQTIQADPAFEVIAEAGTGDAALGLIAQFKPDVAILDLNMPGLSGFEVIAEMRRRRAFQAMSSFSRCTKRRRCWRKRSASASAATC